MTTMCQHFSTNLDEGMAGKLQPSLNGSEMNTSSYSCKKIADI